MAHDREEKKSTGLAHDVKDMHIRPSRSPTKQEAEVTPRERSGPRSSSIHGGTFPAYTRSTTQTPLRSSSMQNSPVPKDEEEEVGGDVEVIQEPGEAPKLSRTMSKKAVSRPPPLFKDLQDATSEAQRTYEVIERCTYGNKYLGTTDHAMDCECNEEWDADTKTNDACDEDSDCINRATKMECVGDCACGANCQNQRFQQQRYASVSVILTEKKGHGLRADVDLPAHTFIYEYIGEVIGEQAFRRRMTDYDKDGIKHFYFMSLNKGEFVDATKRGNLGRFCNHSCNPNCYVDKWVVGDKLRMGIFSERRVEAGEELTFNYNVDRYGANPQPCYCGEPNCTGFIGGKTQTERATKLSAATIEALGIDDGDGWDLAVAKKARKKKAGEEDEEYVDRVEAKSLDEDGVVKVMATLMQCKEKWIAVKLLSRIQRCDEERVRNRVVKMHGYQILKSQISTWMDDANVVLQILYILHRLPRITRNKIQDSGIEPIVEKLLDGDDDRVKDEALSLIKIWSALEMGYRIPRMQRKAVAAANIERERPHRRSQSRSRSRSASPNVPKGPAAPKGPRVNFAPTGPGRGGFFPPRAPPFRRNFNPPPNTLPPGWFEASSGQRPYYYSANGATTWSRPTAPATQPPPPPPTKVATKESALDDIIKGITAAPKEKEKASTPPSASQSGHTRHSNHDRKKPEEKWRTYPIEKQKKLYENTLQPPIKYVMDKYRHKLPRDDLKRFAKDLGKRMVESDYKNKRVHDPTTLTPKMEKNIKHHCREYFDKAVVRKKERDTRKAAERAQKAASSDGTTGQPPSTSAPDGSPISKPEDFAKADEELVLSDMEDDDPANETPSSSHADSELKRKREADDTPLTAASDEDTISTPLKRARSDLDSPQAAPPPPPPPPPPADTPTHEGMEFEDQPPNGVNGHTVHGEYQHYDEEGVGLGLKPTMTEQMNGMEVDNENEDDDDYLVGHWGLDDSTDQRLPVRQGS